MNQRFIVILLCLGIMLSVPMAQARGGGGAQPYYSNVGAIFGIGMGARPLGMGGAFVGLANDENAVYYNPAGLAFLNTSGVTSLISPQFGPITYGGVGMARHLFGFQLMMINSGPISVPGELGAPTGETFTYYSGGGLAAFGIAVTDHLALGTRLKIYHQMLLGNMLSTGTGWALEPSLLFKYHWFRFGVLFENALSGDVFYTSDHQESWHRSLRLGTSLSVPIRQDLRLNVVGGISNSIFQFIGEYTRPLDYQLGVEVWAGHLGARFGVNDHANTVGTSIRSSSWRLDWAYSAYRNKLPDTQRISLTLRF